MQWIKYKVLQSVGADGEIFAIKKVGYNSENFRIAQEEAYNGKYEIIEDEEEFEIEPLAVEFGGTGAKTVEEARANLGIGKTIVRSSQEFLKRHDGSSYTIEDEFVKFKRVNDVCQFILNMTINLSYKTNKVANQIFDVVMSNVEGFVAPDAYFLGMCRLVLDNNEYKECVPFKAYFSDSDDGWLFHIEIDEIYKSQTDSKAAIDYVVLTGNFVYIAPIY